MDLRYWPSRYQYEPLIEAIAWYAKSCRKYMRINWIDGALRVGVDRGQESEPGPTQADAGVHVEASGAIVSENSAQSGALRAGFEALDGDGGHAVLAT